MSAIAAGTLLVPMFVPSVHANGHTPFPWRFFVGAPLIVLGLLLLVGGVVYAVKIRAKARKASDHGPGLLMLFVGAALAGLGFWIA